MALPPHASAAAKSDHELSEFRSPAEEPRASTEAPHSQVTLARDVLRADGLNAIERSEREAAEEQNRAEEAAIFERAAARLRPSWSEADQMLSLGLANALVPEVVVPEVVVPEVVVPEVVAPAPPVAAPIAQVAPGATPSAFPAFAPSASMPPSVDTGYARASDLTDSFPALAKPSLGRLFASRRNVLIAAAAGCVALGGVWAAFSGGEPSPEAPPPAATVSAAPVAPVIIVPPAPVPTPSAVPTPAPVHAAPSRELTREEAAALLGLPPPKPVAKAANKAGVKKPLAKQAAKAPAKAVAKAPLAKQVAKPAAKKPLAPAKKPQPKR